MALPEYSEAVRKESAQAPRLRSREEECSMVLEELPHALEAASHIVQQRRLVLGYWAARAQAQALHLQNGALRDSCTPEISECIWDTSAEAAVLLVSCDPMLQEAASFLENAGRALSESQRGDFVRWWTLRVGAEHYRSSQNALGNARCRAVWLFFKALWSDRPL